MENPVDDRSGVVLGADEEHVEAGIVAQDPRVERAPLSAGRSGQVGGRQHLTLLRAGEGVLHHPHAIQFPVQVQRDRQIAAMRAALAR